MPVASTTWHGTPFEGVQLQAAIASHCECQHDRYGAITRGCAAHVAMTVDQRFLDGLLAYRHLANQLLREEMKEPPDTQ